MIAIAWCFGEVHSWPSRSPAVGWTPSSLRPVPQISHSARARARTGPGITTSPSDTKGHCRTSLKKARIAVASSGVDECVDGGDHTGHAIARGSGVALHEVLQSPSLSPEDRSNVDVPQTRSRTDHQ